jgi:lipid-A-disaccharide synthase
VTEARHRLIMMSAGEASGDLHGATICRALKRLDPHVRVFGMGGARMAAAGMEILVDPTAQAGVGTNEVIGRIPSLFRAYRLLVRRMRRERPQALVVIDFPEFNLRLARHAKRARVPVVYFMPPQLWAWRSGRIRQMASRVTQVLAAFPFERDLYASANIPVEYVGHPLLDVVPFTLSVEEARRRLGLPKEGTVAGLLPGSRREEIEHLLPPMLEAATALARADGRRRFVLGLAPTVSRGMIDGFIGRAAGAPSIEVVEGQTHEVMAAADVLLVASGTATLEAALLGTPMVVCYRVSRLTEVVGRLLKQIPWISLPNIVARRTAVPEILQADVTGARLAAEAERLLDEHDVAAAQRLAFKDLRERLGEPGVGERAARAILKVAGAA